MNLLKEMVKDFVSLMSKDSWKALRKNNMSSSGYTPDIGGGPQPSNLITAVPLGLRARLPYLRLTLQGSRLQYKTKEQMFCLLSLGIQQVHRRFITLLRLQVLKTMAQVARSR